MMEKDGSAGKTEMTVDWSRYPPLPDKPELPPWRDTPEREACYRELKEYESRFFGRSGCVLNVFLFFLFAGGMLRYIPDLTFMKVFYIVIAAFLGALLSGFFILYLCSLPGKWKIMAERGVYMWSLKRPDLSPRVEAILASRPVYSEAAFRRLWPTEEHAENAVKFLKLADKYRHSTGKMLYPNDPPLVFFFGKELKWGKRKICFPPEEFYEDVEDEFRFPEEEWTKLDYDTVPLAEIVERCGNGPPPKRETGVKRGRPA